MQQIERKITLSQLQLLIKDTLHTSIPEYFWVVAEISEIKISGNMHCYLELVEKDASERSIKAKISAIIWGSTYLPLKDYFENETGAVLKAGIKVLLKARVEYHQLYGLNVVVSDIDPSFTMGEVEAKRRRIIKQLKDDGVFNKNRELKLEPFPQRIAVIASYTSAGYRDFVQYLNGNSHGYYFKTELYESIMQGEQNETGVLKALHHIALVDACFDAVVIIRGGGSNADLSWFDNYRIASHVAQFPLPVITGIGHEKDMTVTDLVAYKAAITPTAAANFLVEHTFKTEKHLLEQMSRIKTVAESRMAKTTAVLEFFMRKLVQNTGAVMSKTVNTISYLHNSLAKKAGEQIHKAGMTTEKLNMQIQQSAVSILKTRSNDLQMMNSRLETSTHKIMDEKKQQVETLKNSLTMLNPENILKRGYSITRFKGKTIKSVQQLMAGDAIKTTFCDGKIESIITATVNK